MEVRDMYEYNDGKIAHIRKSDKKLQGIKEHSINTAKLCKQTAKNIHLENLGYLIGILHDMGKCTQIFSTYLKIKNGIKAGRAIKGDVHHSPIGAIFAYERWYGLTSERKLTAQIITMVIYAHHSGFMDVITLSGESPLYDALKQDKEPLCYEEAVKNYLNYVADLDTLDNLFDNATEEIKTFLSVLGENKSKIPIIYGLLAREMLSILVDSDRFDSACFEFDENPFQTEPKTNWEAAIKALDEKLSNIPKSKLSDIRREISDACFSASSLPGRIFRLTVPTGGGKTFSSLRFALNYAKMHQLESIFNIIPYNTILDQNAADMRDALGNTVRILEHHSNVVFEEDRSKGEIENYRILTERWFGCDIILTSMVQFLNSIYTNKNTDARRMCRLSNSVIIFDEIQALPKKCIALFESVINFLTIVCGCTVVLCTATQPKLLFKFEPKEIMPNPARLFSTLRRTQLINESQVAISTEAAIIKSKDLLDRHGSVLFVVNTKKMAKAIYDGIKNTDVKACYLSTDMCPAHRLEVLNEIKNYKGDKPLFCVSTALIEAGINISFPCVIRSLAGLSSIIQATGRCNRNAELPDGQYGQVYIWKLADESLKKLKEIETAQGISHGILAKYACNADSMEAISDYFENEKVKFNSILKYPVKDIKSTTIVDLLGRNKDSDNDDVRQKFVLTGAYRTAGDYFKVIDEDTVSVLTCFGEGENIYLQLCKEMSMNEKIKLLRRAASYSISIYKNVFNELCDRGAIVTLDDAGVYVLRKEFYSTETGVSEEPI